MQLTQKDLFHLCQKAIYAAKKAGELISFYTNSELNIRYKKTSKDSFKNPIGGNSTASQIITEVDIKSQDIILNELIPTLAKYDLALLTEELVDDKSRFKKDYFWCIDPLDGTLPFTEGKEGYSVSIALVSKTGIPFLGAVYDPAKKNSYWAYKDGGAFKNEVPFSLPSKSNQFCLISDRSFSIDPLFNQVYSEMKVYAKKNGLQEFTHINMGGAAMNALWVLENNPGCYFKFPKKHQGGGSLWDFAATTAIYNELKTPVSDIFGKTLNLNKKDSTFMNSEGVIFASNDITAQTIQDLFNKLK